MKTPAVQLALWPQPQPSRYTDEQRRLLRYAAHNTGCKSLREYWAQINPQRWQDGEMTPIRFEEIWPEGDVSLDE